MRSTRLHRLAAGTALIFLFFVVPAAVAQESFRPSLSVNIPTVRFSQIQVQESNVSQGISGYIDVPWIAEYVMGVYRYGIAISGIVAGVIIVIGGFQYMTGKPAEGKEKIQRTLTGVVLVLGSYVILRTISPDLTSFKGIRISTVAQQVLVYDEPGGIDQGISTAPSAGSTSSSRGGETAAFDEYFKKYAPCAGIDWRILKAVAKKESNFRPDVVNKWGFVGLFQTKEKFCSLKKYGRGSECTEEGLKNPDSNTAAAANGQIKVAVNKIKAACPQLRDAKRFTMFVYYAHNSGAGALQAVLKKVGCDASDDEYFKASSEFWAARNTSGKPIPNQDGRMQYALKVAESAVGYGVTDPLAVTGECPL